MAAVADAKRQEELFSEEKWREAGDLVNRLPYNFFYEFEDEDGKRSRMQILDWEIGALFWNCLRRHGGDAKTALEKVRARYVDDFFKTDLHFFLGTTLHYQFVAPNPWLIVGVFPIPYESQPDLL